MATGTNSVTSAPTALDPHRALRDDVRLLGELLGETLRRQEGQDALRARRARAGAGQADPRVVRRTGSRRSPTSCARCRSNRRCRSRAASRSSSTWPTSPNSITACAGAARISAIRAPVRSRPRSKRRFRGCCRAACRPTICTAPSAACGIELVVTAHPTEIMRRSLQHKYRRIADALAELDHSDVTLPRARNAGRDPAARDHGGVGDRRGAPRAAVAARRSAIGAGRVRGDAVGRAAALSADRSIARLRQCTGRGLPLDAAPIRFGSWIGGDRDGNPFVTPEVTRSACLMARWIGPVALREGDRAAALRAVDVGRDAGARWRTSTARTSRIARCCARSSSALEASRRADRGACARRRSGGPRRSSMPGGRASPGSRRPSSRSRS